MKRMLLLLVGGFFVWSVGACSPTVEQPSTLPAPNAPSGYADYFWGSPDDSEPAPPAVTPPADNEPAPDPTPPDDPAPPDDPPPPAQPDDPVVEGDPPPPAGEQCLDGPNKQTKSWLPKVYYGTAVPTYLPMTDGQIMAVGNFWGCSGLLIAPTWVLSAEHCGLWSSSEFCIGVDAKNPNVCIPGKNVYNHPSGDIALMELSQDATQLLPGVEPVPILTEDLDDSWLGQTAEAAGYGGQETGASNEREFTAEPIVWLGWDTMTIDGEGKHGVCFGDSGGPLMVIAGDGSVRVAGALSTGSDSCVGQDNFTRVDAYRDWIESYTGPTVLPGPQPCGDVDTVGSCNADANRAVYCGADSLLTVENCTGPDVCSWDVGAAGWRCINKADDPCSGITNWGDCGGNTLSWCDQGGLQQRNCEACDETCVPNDAWGYWCVPSTCGSLQFSGECTDSWTVRWCNRDGEVETKNCGSTGQSCGWVDDATGFWCQ